MHEIFDLASRQSGLVTRGQAYECGVSETTVWRWIRRGVWKPVGGGVLIMAGVAPTREILSRISVLRYPDAIITGPGAADFLQIPILADVDDRPWLIMQRVRPIDAVQLRHPSPSVIMREGLAIARPRQAILDCLRRLDWQHAKDLGARALQRRDVTLADLRREIDRLHGTHGNAQLRRLARRFAQGSKEESERRMDALLRRAGIRGYRLNVVGTLPGYGECELDFVFDAARLVVEVDGFEYHSSPLVMQRDNEKQNALVNLGWEVLRFTWSDVVDRPGYIVEQVTIALMRRSAA